MRVEEEEKEEGKNWATVEFSTVIEQFHWLKRREQSENRVFVFSNLHKKPFYSSNSAPCYAIGEFLRTIF